MKKIKISTILLIIFLMAVVGYAAFKGRGAVALTGGTQGSLDSIDGSELNDGDKTPVFTNEAAHFYHMNASSGAAENSPFVIAPDTNAGNKRWELLNIRVPDPTSDDDVGDQGYNDIRHPLRTEWEYDYIDITAGAFVPTDTNGAEFGTHEYVTNDRMKDYYAFPGDIEKFVDIDFIVKEQWNEGTFRIIYYWSPGSSACTAGDTVEWEIAGDALGDGDTIDTAPGTPVVISDTVLAGKDTAVHKTSTSPALTLGNTPSVGDLIQLKVSRNVSGTDDMTEHAWLFRVFIQYKKNKTVSEWN